MIQPVKQPKFVINVSSLSTLQRLQRARDHLSKNALPPRMLYQQECFANKNTLPTRMLTYNLCDLWKFLKMMNWVFEILSVFSNSSGLFVQYSPNVCFQFPVQAAYQHHFGECSWKFIQQGSFHTSMKNGRKFSFYQILKFVSEFLVSISTNGYQDW